MTGPEEEVVVDEASARDAQMISELIAAVAAGNAERAADLTAHLVMRRTVRELYGVCGGVAQYGVNTVVALNSDPKVPEPRGGGPWTAGHIRPSAATGPGEVFACAFLDAYAEGGSGSEAVQELFHAMVRSGPAYVTYCLSHLVRLVAGMTCEALAHHLTAGGGRST